MTAEELLELTDVSVDYGNARALFGVSLTVTTGKAVAVLGSNGAGKSTLARAIAGVTKVSAGSIHFDDIDITAAPAYKVARAGLALVPEGRGVFPGLSVEDNLRSRCGEPPTPTRRSSGPTPSSRSWATAASSGLAPSRAASNRCWP